MIDEVNKLINEDISLKDDCDFCNESKLDEGDKTKYGSVIIYKIGNSNENGWFATISPKTGGDPEENFTIQLMPFGHLVHFSQITKYGELAKNYGIAFSKINEAMAKVMILDKELKATADKREEGISIVQYGKCTTWKEKKEHIHIKIFPFRGNMGQPYTVDSSFGRKEVLKDKETGEEFVKMKPVRKVMVSKERFERLSMVLIKLLK